MKINLIVRTGTLLLILLGALLFPKSVDAITLTLAHYQDYKPYAYVDPDGRSRGMLIDIWRLWAEKNNVDLTFIPARLSRCLELVKKGEADIVLGLFQ